MLLVTSQRSNRFIAASGGFVAARIRPSPPTGLAAIMPAHHCAPARSWGRIARLGGSAWLREFDDVSVGAMVARRPYPWLSPRCMDDVDTRVYGSFVRRGQVVDPEPDLRSRCRGAVLRLVKGEVHEGAIGPTDRGVTTADPLVVADPSGTGGVIGQLSGTRRNRLSGANRTRRIVRISEPGRRL